MLSLLQQAQLRGEEWFFELVQYSSDVLVVVDEKGLVLYANPAASLAFGVPAERTIGRSGFQYVHPDDLESITERFAGLDKSPGASDTTTVRFVSAGGEVRVLEVVVTNCLQNEAIAGIVVNGRDVTERNQYMERLEGSFDAITLAVANTVELRDPYTAGHQREVAHIATAVARELDLTAEEIKGIGVASTIHDIGKISVPSEILNRPGKLSPAEFEIIKSHCQSGHDIVTDVPFPWPVAQMILQHHERIDGSGYPNGLEGDTTLLGSRILAVADVISAMSEHRPYRAAPGMRAALAEIEANKGVLYDPAAADASLRLIRDGLLTVRSS